MFDAQIFIENVTSVTISFMVSPILIASTVYLLNKINAHYARMSTNVRKYEKSLNRRLLAHVGWYSVNEFLISILK